MMKHNTIAIASMAVSVLAGMASAQDTFSTTTTTTTVATATTAPRTGLYTDVTKGNAAAEKTVDDYSRRPTLIGDRQYLAGWGNESLVNGAYSIQGHGFNWFGAVLAVDSMSQIRAGLASGTAWGAGVIVGVRREYVKTAPPSTEVTTYYAPSGFGLFGDFNLGSSDVYGQVGWNTGVPSLGGLQNSVLTKAPAPTAEDDDQNHTLSIMAGWKKDATTEGTHAFGIEGSYASEMRSLENPTVDEKFNTINLAPAWGYILRANNSYSVYLGTNGLLSYMKPEDGSAFAIAISPNFAFHKHFIWGFEGFSGFSVTGSMYSEKDMPEDTEFSQLLTSGADMAVGLRWVKDNFALEGSLKESFLANGPNFIGGGTQGLLGQIGLSLGI